MGVVINDGDYIALGGFEPTPGGVDISALGYALDLWVDGNNSTNTSWRNLAFSNYSLEKFSVNAPIIRNSRFNFHKEIFFGNAPSSRLRTSTNAPVVSGSSYYVFVVSESPNANGTLLTFNTNNTGASLRWLSGTGNILSAYWNTTPRDAGANNQPRYGIATLNVVNQNSSAANEIYHNGIKNTFSLGTNAAQGAVSATQDLLIGNASNSATTGSTDPFNGAIQEIIIMEKPSTTLMSATDIARVHSYLAIKYGITLNQGSNNIADNYIASDGATVVWNRSVNSGYNNYIIGIGRDRASGLYQKQAKNVDNTTLTVFLGSKLYNINSDNDGNLNDMEIGRASCRERV